MVEVLNFRLEISKETGSRNARNENLVTDLIIAKTGCCSYDGSDGILNG